MATANRARPAACETITTATVLERCVARPPRKSAAPYANADRSAMTGGSIETLPTVYPVRPEPLVPIR
jgi:hypothetical protein